MKKHAWLVALMFLAAGMTVGTTSAVHAPTPGPYLDLAVDRSLTNPNVWVVSYSAHAWGANVSAFLQGNGLHLANSLQTPHFSGALSVFATACDSFKLHASDGSQSINHTIRLGDACDGSLADYDAPAGASSKGSRPVEGDQHRSHGELRSGGILSAPGVSLVPEPDAWSQSTIADRVGVTLWHAAPWCGTMILHGVANTLADGEEVVGVEVTHDGNVCPEGFPPVVDLGPNQTKKMKGVFVLEGTVADPDTANHLVVIDWGDGSSDSAHSVAGIFTATHQYDGKGSWTVTACASDNLFTACDTMQITQGSTGGKGGGKPDKGDGHPGGGKGKK